MAGASEILTLFIQIALIIALSRVLGWFFGRLRQPQVIGEMIAGILLGPSLLGWLAPHAFAHLFPPASLDNLNILSQLGVVFFLFLVGLELDPTLLQNRGRAAVGISTASIAVPFVLGMVLALGLYRPLFDDPTGQRLVPSLLFMGAAMSITAFPVLARILTERNLHKTHVGGISIACAAVNDVAAWCILAFVVATAQPYRGTGEAVRTAILAAVYIAAMFFLVRPFLRRLESIYGRHGRLNQNVVGIIFLLVLASSFATDVIGIHALFGAFVVGFIMPKGTAFVRHISEKLEDFTVVFLLPLFFASTGLKTQITLLNTPSLWLYTLLIIAVACAGKFGGTFIAARVFKTPWRESAAIGILMNTRGLMELIILAIGRELHVITDTVFAMMVLMAIATTLMTAPLLHWIYPTPALEREKRKKEKGTYSVLLPVSLPESGGALLALADMLTGPQRTLGQIYALHLRPATDRDAYDAGRKASDVQDEVLSPLLEEARRQSIPVEPLTVTSSDVAADIAALAGSRQVNLVLMGFHRAIIGQAYLGGTVHRVMANCPAHVGVLVDRGLEKAQRILVPYLGSAHDRLALELAQRLTRNTQAAVTVLHVVPPAQLGARQALDAQGATNRVFNDPAAPAPVTFKVVVDAYPVNAVVRESKDYDLVIVGVAEEWGLESHLFGWRPQRIARDCTCSLLIVRRHAHHPQGNGGEDR